jgi:hypothetical protein
MKNSKIMLFVALGAAFWYQAAMIIRYFGKSVFSEGNPKLILFFVLAVPITIASMYITALIAKLKSHELLKPVVIMTLTATFLDGIALAFYRNLYSNSFEVAMYGSSMILWGVGVGLLLSFYLDMKSKKQEMA